MIDRRSFLLAVPGALLAARELGEAMAQGVPPARNKGVLLMNRIGPSSSELYVANADGSGERKLLQESVFEYNAAWGPDGKSVVFTSERMGLGQSDVFRARADGTGIEPLVVH